MEKSPLRVYDGGVKTKGIDATIVSKLLKLAMEDQYETAILVTGDGDFAEPVRTVQNQGKNVVVASFASRMSTDLATVADDYIRLDDHAHRLRRN